MAAWNIIVQFVSIVVLSLLVCHARDFAYENKCDYSAESFWQACNATSELEKRQCENLGCCYAPIDFIKQLKIKNINITGRCLRPIEKSGLDNGSCLYYDGSVCGSYLQDIQNNNTLHTLRYVDNSFGVARTDQVFKKFFEVLINHQDIRKNKECLQLMKSSMCKYGIPRCRVDNTSEPICREDCEYIFDICRKELSALVGIIGYIIYEENIDFTHLVLPDCSNLSYSWEVEEKSSSSCGYLFDNIGRKPKEEKKDNKQMLIYIGIAASVVLVLIIGGIIAFDRYKTKKKKKNKTDLEFIASMTSIRDRLRQDSTSQNPLLELLASSKPGDLVQYPLDCVEYIQDLGEGQFGKVFQGRVHGVVKGEESTDVAVKCLKEGSTGKALDAFHQEVALMSVLRHSNVLQLLAVSTEEEPYCMIFEFMENGDLNEYLRKRKSKEVLSESDQLKICWHVASGMEYLASKKFLHRDLATRNCLVGKDLIVKIADFGMSRNVYHSDYYRVGGEAMLPIRWMPPEAILYGKFTVASDVYSYGVVMWEVFSYALQPFYGYSNEEVVEFIKKGVLLPMPEDCPEWVYDTMLLCWKRDIEDRITFTEVLKIFSKKDSEANYQKPRKHASPNATYSLLGEDDVTFATSSSYDHPQKTQSVNHKRKSSLSKVNLQNEPRYQNLIRENEEELSTNTTSPDLPPKSSNHNYQNISPSTSGELNQCFEDDDVKLIKQKQSLKVDSKIKDGKSSPQKSPRSQHSIKVRASIEAKTARRASSIDKGMRAASLGGGRSIKEVLKNDARYVSSESLKRNNSIKKPDEDRPSSSFESSFRPTSEFLEFHGYGKDIKSSNEEERKHIQKLIDQSLNTDHTTEF